MYFFTFSEKDLSSMIMNEGKRANFRKSASLRRRKVMHKFHRYDAQRKQYNDPEEDYFEKVIESRDLLLRLPIEQPADPIKIANQDFWEMCSLYVPETSAESYSAKTILNIMAHSIRRADFQKLLNFTPKLYRKVPGYISIVLFGYAIAFYGSEKDEDILRELIESVDIPLADVPHITHFLDELAATQYSPYTDFMLPRMLTMMGLESHLLRLSRWVQTDFCEKGKPIPFLNPHNPWRYASPDVEHVMKNLFGVIGKTRDEVAATTIISEGYDKDDAKRSNMTTEEVTSVLQSNNWEEIASLKLTKEDGVLPMMQQAHALIKMKKYSDFINYVTDGFRVSRNPALINLRACGWLMLGALDLAERDKRWGTEDDTCMFDSKV